jgi:hypothetical protein
MPRLWSLAASVQIEFNKLRSLQKANPVSKVCHIMSKQGIPTFTHQRLSRTEKNKKVCHTLRETDVLSAAFLDESILRNKPNIQVKNGNTHQ